MTEPDARTQGLLAANTAFYGAFEQLDLAAMRDVWADHDGIICIHPGWTMCRGREEVEDSWRRIFENTPYIEFGVTVIDCGVSGAGGWIVCEEAILQSHPNGMTRSVVPTASTTALGRQLTGPSGPSASILKSRPTHQTR